MPYLYEIPIIISISQKKKLGYSEVTFPGHTVSQGQKQVNSKAL